MNFKKPFVISFREGFFLAFVLGFLVRLIPEVLSFPYPIGFDTVYYAARMKSGIIWYNWSSFFSTWLVYSLLVPLYSVTKILLLSQKFMENLSECLNDMIQILLC